MLDRALELTNYHAKVKQFAAHNLTSSKKKGIGIAAFLHGAGFTGSGERYLNALVGLEATAAGGLRVLVSSTEFGQGTNTILCQIAAETLGLEYDDISMAPDRYQHQPQQRSHRGFAHGDDHRQDRADRGVEDAADADR